MNTLVTSQYQPRLSSITKIFSRRINQLDCSIQIKLNKIWYDLKDHNMAPKQWISIRNILIYLEIKFCPNQRIFVFWWPFWIQNGHHSKPKWSPYGAACLTPCKYPFPLKSFHFWIFNNLFLFFLFLYWWPFWKF
jgi:hypothetical protein